MTNNNKALAITGLTLTLFLPANIAQAENLAHTQQLLSTRQCQGCELSGVGLVLANLAGANLAGANLAGANLSRANLAGANLMGANLAGVSLYGANLTGANLTGALLNATDLRGAYMSGADLTGVDLSTSLVIGAIGLSVKNQKPEDLYRLGVAEAKAGNYRNAIDYYNQAIAQKSDLAAAYFGRSMAWADLGNYQAATVDAETARQIFVEKGSKEGEELSNQLAQTIEMRQQPTMREPKSGGFMNALGSILPTLLQLAF